MKPESAVCVFCSIVATNEPHHEIVWQDAHDIAFLCQQPSNPGHLLVIPREHVDYVFDLSPEAYATLMKACRKLAGPLKRFSGKRRIAMAVDGFQIPHVHVHLVPVEKTGDLCNKSIKASPETLAREGEELRELYRGLA